MEQLESENLLMKKKSFKILSKKNIATQSKIKIEKNGN